MSLGNFCQTAHQIRRITGDGRASFFDWLVTPATALVRVLESGFTGVFEAGNLVITEDGHSVCDRANGLMFHHSFRKDAEDRVIPASLREDYPEQRRKVEFLISRWREMLRSEPVTLVWQENPTSEQALRVVSAISRRNRSAEFTLLLANKGDYRTCVNHPRIRVASMPAPPGGWTGDDASWDRLIEEHRHVSPEDKAPRPARGWLLRMIKG